MKGRARWQSGRARGRAKIEGWVRIARRTDDDLSSESALPGGASIDLFHISSRSSPHNGRRLVGKDSRREPSPAVSTKGMSQVLPRDSRLVFLNLPRLLAAASSVVFQREGDFVALVERPDARCLESRRMDEHVFRAILWGNKAEAFGAVEELDRAGDSHGEKPSRVREVSRPTMGPHLAWATQVWERALPMNAAA